ncbi:MAG: hypothetical protein ACJAQS_001835 [Porticoccus sp.]|jgi:hypothetical protein
MSQNLIYGPVLAQIVLTFCVFILLARRKAADIKAGIADRGKSALDNKAWSEPVVKVSNNIDNQFQTPVLFYALCFVLAQLGAVTAVSLGLAWFYAVSRYLHMFVHTGSNHVPHRMPLFLGGVLALMVMTGLAIFALVSAA